VFDFGDGMGLECAHGVYLREDCPECEAEATMSVAIVRWSVGPHTQPHPGRLRADGRLELAAGGESLRGTGDDWL
jgi:hypothetical protein